ncbi:hypothetical protein K504DRAFT_487710 [Pleomassaria siparia CBS 279.74]|uniref:Ubiquitin 3 binding protein But2 C-terminal domain-containing protein n=1 Tax=Pleomassaria siparia CBS 279.74 TaxID=1314801 RepID=A0A6G1KKV3_9PLEO|nr:hypothetical protein K504DRAFT_487710 [Pleomassaria siparia CBS 279.74]
MKSLILATALAALPTVFSLPDVVAKELPATCSSYPGYDATTQIAGPWILQFVNTENPAIDGFGSTAEYSLSVSNSGPTLRWGSITIPTRNDIAKTPLECTNNTLAARVPTEVTAAGAPTNVQWTPLVLSPYPYDMELMYKITGGIPVKIFEHYINGTKQPGVFLGAGVNDTTWGFKYQAANVGSYRRDYYSIRVLGEGFGEMLANETRGFVRIYE